MSDLGLTRDQIQAEKAERKRLSDAVTTATACADVCYATGNLTLDDALQLVSLPLSRCPTKDYPLVIAALAARVARLEQGVDKRAVLALAQIRSVLDGFDGETP